MYEKNKDDIFNYDQILFKTMESYHQEFIRYCQRFSFIYQKEGKWFGLIQPYTEIYNPIFQFITRLIASEEGVWIRIQRILIEPFLVEELCNKISGIIALQENNIIFYTSKDINNKYGKFNNKNINETLYLLPSQVVIEPIFNGYSILKIND